jgi:peptidoglycan/LPS O-acetylase OafA/YrhL
MEAIGELTFPSRVRIRISSNGRIVECGPKWQIAHATMYLIVRLPTNATTVAPKPVHYQVLDGFRGLAILLVFIYHAFHTTHLTALPVRVLEWVGGGGWVGVDLFFVLSGFLITGILTTSLGAPQYFRNFYIRRSLRIFPLFYGVMLLLLALTPVLRLEWHRGHLSYLVYCQNIGVAMDPVGIGYVQPSVNLSHLWSLAVEEQYYLLWPLTIWLIQDERKIMRLCLYLVGVSLVLRLALLVTLPSEVAWEWAYNMLPTHWDGLLLGSWLAMARRQWSVEELLRRTRWPVVVSLAIIVVVVASTRSLDYHKDPMVAIGYPAIAVTFAGLLLRCLAAGSWQYRFFSLGFLRFMGRYSYGFYVYHRLFSPMTIPGLYWLEAKLHSRFAGAVLYLLLWFAGSIMIAVLSYKYFESPFLNLKDRFTTGRGQLQPRTSARARR